MTIYQYHAFDKQGAFKKGSIDAHSAADATANLLRQGLTPTKIHVNEKSNHPLTLYFKPSISIKELSLITRQLATLLNAGVPLESALQGVSEQNDRPHLQRLLQQMRTKILEGFAFAQALEEHPNIFNKLYCATVAAGEQTGHLDSVLIKLADYVEKQQKIRNAVSHALIYPGIMMSISIGIIIFLLIFVVPQLIGAFSSSGQALPLSTRILIAFSNFMQTNYLILLACCAMLSLIAAWSWHKPTIKNQLAALLLKIPILSHFIIAIHVSRYLHTFSILFGSGVNILDAMKVANALLTLFPMQCAFTHATDQVREGQSISSTLQATGFLQAITCHLIASGEKSGQLIELMERAANQLDDEVSQQIDTGLTLLEPFIILFMGSVVLFIVLATLLPILSMQELIV